MLYKRCVMMSRYAQIIDEVYRECGVFAAPYEIDRKRFAFSLQLLDEQQVIRGKRILDLGSGVGIFALALSKLGAKVFGLDKFIFPHSMDNPYKIKDFESLRKIWDRNGLQITEGDLLAALPFSDREFDAVNCDATIEHLPYSPQHLFTEVKRVLRPQGVFLITTPNFANLLRRIRFLFGKSPQWDIRDYFERGELFTGHRREFTVSELCTMVSLSGFTIRTWCTKNSFLNWSRILHPQKWRAHWCTVFSLPFPRMRDIIFLLAQKL